MKAPVDDCYRKFGSIRVLRDGRVRFKPWTFPGLRHFCFAAKGESIEVERGARVVLYLWAPRSRMASACFAYDLSPDKLRELVSELRKAGHGLERWIIPGLEYTRAALSPSNYRPQLLASIADILESCRDLPIAEQWKRVRANVFASAEQARAARSRAEKTGARKKQARRKQPSP